MYLRVTRPGLSYLSVAAFICAGACLGLMQMGLPYWPTLFMPFVFMFVRLSGGWVFRADHFVRLRPLGLKSMVAYRDIKDIALVRFHVQITTVIGQRFEVPFTAGTAQMLSFFLKLNRVPENRLSQQEWAKAQRVMAISDFLNDRAAFRFHGYFLAIILMAGALAFGFTLSHGGNIIKAWWPYTQFLAVTMGFAAVIPWFLGLATFSASSGNPRDSYQGLLVGARSTARAGWIVGGMLAAGIAGMTFWLDREASEKGYAMAPLVAQWAGVSSAANRMPASR